MSIGDLLMGVNSTQNQIGQAIRPQPQPSPELPKLPGGPPVAPGGSPAPPGGGGASPPSGALSGPPAPPSVAPQSPPDLMQLYQQLYQRERAAQGFDRSLGLMAAALSAPGTANNVWNSMPPPQDPGQQMNTMMQLAQMQRMANMPAPAGMDAPTWAMMPPDAKLKYIEAQGAANIQVSTTAREAQAKDVEEFKNNGIQDFSSANQKLIDSEAGVDQLLKNMPATMKALSDPDILTTSKFAPWNPFGPSEATRQQAIAIQKLEAGLTGEALSSVKNVRNLREFNTLGEALTAGLNVNNGPEGVQRALEAIKQKMAVAHAQVYATAGKEIPYQYAGLADSAYTSKTLDNGQPNPYYTGATYAPPPKAGGEGQGPAGTSVTITGPDDIAKLPKGTPFIIPSGPNQGKTGYAQ
jgi:hypothetical protein